MGTCSTTRLCGRRWWAATWSITASSTPECGCVTLRRKRVGIEDAARAMLLAAEHGRAGERYIVSDKYMSVRELHEIAATAVGRRVPRIGIPMPVLRAGARGNDVLARLLGRDLPFAYVGMQMVELMSPLDHGKAERELGWRPEPVEDSIRKAAVFFASR